MAEQPSETSGVSIGAGAHRHGEWLRNLPALIAAATALVTAIAALRKPPDTSVSKAGYEELSKSIEQLVMQSRADHDQIVALHAHMQALERFAGAVRRQSLVSRVAGDRGEDRSGERPRTEGGRRPRTEAGRAEAPAAEADRPPAAPASPPTAAGLPEAMTPLPPIKTDSQVAGPQGFDAVMQRAKKQ